MPAFPHDDRQASVTTYTGLVFNPFNPDTKAISIEDIARSLSLQARFCGHIVRFMSVAQHCYIVSMMCQTLEGQRWGLLHDAAESYISDVPKPFKKYLPLFQEVEDRILYTIGEKFGLVWPIPDEVHSYDRAALYREARDLMPGGAPMPAPDGIEIPEETLKTMSTGGSRRVFMERFYELGLGK